MKHKNALLLKVAVAILVLAVTLPASVVLARSERSVQSGKEQTIQGEMAQQTNVYATAKSNMNLRAKPSTSGKVLGQVKRDTTVPVLGRDSASRWIFVEAGSKRGWIAGWLTTVQGDLSMVPVTDQVGGPAPLSCSVLPAGGFLTIWQNNLDLQASLGCPTSYHPRIQPDAWEVQTSYQPFQHGVMIWSNHVGWYSQPIVYVIYANSTYKRFDDTFDPSVDPAVGNGKPPLGLVEPAMGFGKIWREQPGVRKSLGWATAGETPGTGRFQLFLDSATDVSGDMIWLSQTNKTYAFPWKPPKVSIFDIPY